MDKRTSSISNIKLPPGLLRSLTLGKLKEIDKQDEATFYQFFEDLNLEDVKKIREKSQQIRDANKELAVTNLDLEPRFMAVKSQLLAGSNELNALKEKYDEKFLQLKVIQSKMSNQAIQKELIQAVQQTEQDSENMAADFVGGKSPLSVEEFTESFIKQRTLYWLRKVKSEKMKELIRPVPVPRTVHKHTPTTTSPIPTSYSTPLQSLPPQHSQPPSRRPEPSSSLPPYPPQPRMPMPQGGMGGMPMPRGGMPIPQRVPVNSYYGAGFANSVPVRPAPYANRFNQHRY